MVDRPPIRKRRDSLQDQISAPVYTNDPLPPYISIIKDLIYISYRADKKQARGLLPEGLTPVEAATITLAFWYIGAGWGIADVSVGFFAIAVEEFAAPDTSEAAYFVEAVMSGPSSRLARQHYGPFQPGGVEIAIDADGVIDARMWSEGGGEIVRAIMRPNGPLQPQAANDRYIGRVEDGRLMAAFTTVTGPSRPCEVLSLAFGDTVSPALQALASREVLFAVHSPELLFCWSASESIENLGPANGEQAGRTALLDILDRQAQACAILSIEGTVLHANSEANRLLSRLPPGTGNPLRLSGAVDQAKFRSALADCAVGRLDRGAGRFLLGVGTQTGPLILQLATSDPALAGPGTMLALLADPSERGMLKDPGLLQLLGLTPGEARIAAAVGAGLPPREAAQELGLKESTVRSALKVIFGKLGLARQTDLVRMITRLDLR